MLLRTLLPLFSLLSLTSNFASASFPSALPLGRRTILNTLRRDLLRREPGNWDIPKLAEAQYVELPVDHFGAANGTFKNRYWIYDAAYKPGGPVIIDDGGEDNAEKFINSMRDSVAQSFANATGGIVINWEHRFYGKSKPEVADATVLEPDKLGEYYKYLTVEQALEDFVTFAKTFKYKGQDMSSGTVPWVFVGASYPGARAAWLRDRNPEIVYVSLASSAPVQVQAEFPEYQETVFEYYDSHGFKACMNDLRGLIEWMGGVVDDKQKSNYEGFMNMIWKNKDSDIYNVFFNANSTTGSSSWDQAKATLSPLIDYVFGDYQYGENSTVIDFCNDLESRGKNSVDSSNQRQKIESDGLVATVGLQTALPVIGDTFHSFFTNILSNSSGSDTTSSNNAQNLDQCKAGDKEACQSLITPDMSWMYQGCSEMGYFFTRDHNLNSAMKFKTLKYSIDTCVHSFGQAVSDGPSLAPVKKYGGNKEINPSNTFWVDGQYDPWRPTTLNALDSGRVPSDNIPNLGKTLDGNKFFGAVINNTFHIPLHTCFATVVPGEHKISEQNAQAANCQPGTIDAQQLFLDALKLWLPQFRKRSLDATNLKVGGNKTSSARSVEPSIGLLIVLAVAVMGFH